MLRSMVAFILFIHLVFQPPGLCRASQTERPYRVYTPVDLEIGMKLLERLRGQTSDLNLDLFAFNRIDPTSGFAATEAWAYCNQSDADVVVWAVPDVLPESSRWIVGITTCKDGVTLLRHIDTVRPGIDATEPILSGAIESIALVMRGALGVLVQGGELGVVTPSTGIDSSSQQATNLKKGASPARSTEGSAKEVEMSSKSQGMVRNASTIDSLTLVGWTQSWDGADAFGQPAAHATIAVGKEFFQVGVAASLGLGFSVEDRYTEITLRKHSLAVQWRQRLLRDSVWSLTAGVDLGSVFFERTTRVIDISASARAQKLIVVPLVAPWTCLARRIGPIWLALGAGFDGLLSTPHFVYATNSGSTDALQLWPVAPRLFLSLAVGQP